jgi:hypothetical protein
LLATEPVTSEEAGVLLEENGFSKRDDSELQLTAATVMIANAATRGHASERRGSTTLRIGATHSNATQVEW